MADVELVIKLDHYAYRDAIAHGGNSGKLVEAVRKGTPLEKHDEEVIKETVESIWGKPPCDDAISRQAVDELSKELVHTTRDKADFLCNFWERLQKLPPVYPQNTNVLDKIRAEIEQNAYPIVHGVNNHELGMTLYGILQVIDKYRKGQTDADSD